MIEEINDIPKFVAANYREKYNEAIKQTVDTANERKYVGTGTTISGHPLRFRCNMQKKCGNCENKNVDVIFARFARNPINGKEYSEYEIYCPDCLKYTARYWAD